MSGTLFDTWGQAPGAKVISVAMFKPGATIDDSWAFAVEGPDGTPGTGDEANIASNSWGWTDQPASGWEYYSRLKYYLNTIYAPHTVFVQSTGNEGPGYAKDESPNATSSIQAGAATSKDVFWLFQLLGGGNGYGGGPQHSWPLGLNGTLGPGPYGDVVSFSSRGPNSLGQPGPDILGIGEAGIAGIPVNEVFSGQDAFDIFFAGTSQAAPNIAGIVALIMEAYASAHGGQMPTTAVIQSILKTTADDVHQETIAQGAGFADALRAVKVAKEIEGVTSDVHEWIPGGFDGKHRDMFVNLLAPGASDKTKITLTNHRSSPVTVSLSTGVFERSGTFSFNWIYPNTCAGGLRTGRPDFWVFNKTGVWNSHDPDHPGDALAKAADPGLPALWDGADLMKVYAYTDPKVATQRGALGLYDWVDVNGNGIWDRFTEESYIAPVVFGGDFAGGQLNARTVYSPGVRIHSGLGISASALAGTCSGGPLPETLYVEFYQRVPWSVLSLDRSSVTIPAAGTATVNVTATVPAGTAPGSYAGGVYYNDGSNTSTIQVLINVPVTRLPGNLGGRHHGHGRAAVGIPGLGCLEPLHREAPGAHHDRSPRDVQRERRCPDGQHERRPHLEQPSDRERPRDRVGERPAPLRSQVGSEPANRLQRCHDDVRGPGGLTVSVHDRAVHQLPVQRTEHREDPSRLGDEECFLESLLPQRRARCGHGHLLRRELRRDVYRRR